MRKVGLWSLNWSKEEWRLHPFNFTCQLWLYLYSNHAVSMSFQIKIFSQKKIAVLNMMPEMSHHMNKRAMFQCTLVLTMYFGSFQLSSCNTATWGNFWSFFCHNAKYKKSRRKIRHKKLHNKYPHLKKIQNNSPDLYFLSILWVCLALCPVVLWETSSKYSLVIRNQRAV